ncbi:MAG: ATP-binding protein [Thermodesulfobacteriota bacterium]
MPTVAGTMRRALLGVPLGLKILGLALSLIFLCGAAAIHTARNALNENIENFLREESRLVASELSYQVHDYLLINDIYGLTQMLKNTIQNRPDLRYIVVGDGAGQVVAHTFEGGFPSDMLGEGATLAFHPLGVTTLHSNEGTIWEARTGIGGGEGIVVVGVKGGNLRRQVGVVVRSLGRTTILVAAFGALVSLWLTWLITHPVNRLLEAIRTVRRGDYTLILPPPEGQDEVGKLIEGFNDMTRALAQADRTRQERELLQRDFLQRVMAGQEGERKRIARELHDQTGQALASFMVDLKVLENAQTTEEMRQGITRLKKGITEEMEAIHDLAVALRPSVLDDLGLIAAVEMLVVRINERGMLQVRTTMVGFGKNRPDACAETCAYRLVQEALANVLKHAEATEATVLLEWRGDKIRGVVEDNGSGFAPDQVDSKTRLGILGMKERAELIQGSCRIESSPDQGTMVVFEIPAKVGVCHET